MKKPIKIAGVFGIPRITGLWEEIAKKGLYPQKETAETEAETGTETYRGLNEIDLAAFQITPAKGKYLSRLGEVFNTPRRFYEWDWLYRRRLMKVYRELMQKHL